MQSRASQRCINPDCGSTFDIGEVLFACNRCGELLDIIYDWSRCRLPKSLKYFASRWSTAGRTPEARADFSGVWRFRELLPFAEINQLVTIGEGRTLLHQADQLAAQLNHQPGQLFLQYEGFNPSGSFKDNGMAAAFTVARRLGRRRVVCASTGNTSASLALYARQTTTHSGEPMQAVVLIGDEKIAYGKLAQALDFGAATIQVRGDFDACMKLVREAADRLGLYLVNSVNPFRLEGQKTIMYRVLEGLDWAAPDWIIVPGGNLGNTSAFGKAFAELRQLGLCDRIPRLAVINAAGANTLSELFNEHGLRFNGGRLDHGLVDAFYAQCASESRHACTVASAIEIGRPVNLIKALRSLEIMDGVVRQVSDEEILDGKALVGRFGYGCEPAGGATIAGLRLLRSEGVIAPSDRVACILTGHALKDADATVRYHCPHNGAPPAPFANPPTTTDADIQSIAQLLE
jgi:threonine synthase